MENGKAEDTISHPEKRIQMCVIGDSLKQNGELIKAVKHFHLPIVYSSDGHDLMNKTGENSRIYILEEFESELFANLLKLGQRILGPPIVIECAKQNKDLPNKNKPLYCSTMKNLVLSFTGFRSKEEMTLLCNLAHYMSASIRKEISLSKNTHLVATTNGTGGEKYKYAASCGLPIMSKEWILQAWVQRHNIDCKATDPELMQYKILPFVGCKLAFLEYPPEEQKHMTEIALKNGGEVVEPKDPSCTHIVVEDDSFIFLSEYGHHVNILRNEWFWACLQIEAKAEEKMYIYENVNSVFMTSSVMMPETGSKREKLESIAHQLAIESQEQDFHCMPDFNKIDTKMYIPELSLDHTFTRKSSDVRSSDSTDSSKQMRSPPVDMRLLTPRQQISYELFQTESNYVGILHIIMTLFKESIENHNEFGRPLLAPAEIKIIFGNLPPIYEVHLEMLDELTEYVQNQKEHGIGNIILKHAQGFAKSYPPFVNFFEKSKEVLAICDATKPRFHAFLKCCQSKPECGRQTLQELLIRPVQRLPSIILLLTDLLKHTTKGSKDYQVLEKSIQAVKDVLKHINEDKRKTDCQIAMFDIVNDIENCPPNLLSSHRNFVSKTDVQEITDFLNCKGSVITLLLFTDVLEICKKRNKVADSKKDKKNKNVGSSAVKAPPKSYKHLELIPLSHLKRVVNVTETEGCKNTFAIVFWSSKDLKELLYAFQLLDDDIHKSAFLRALCHQIARSLCRPEAESLLTILEPEQLDLETSENTHNLAKALKRTQSKLGSNWSLKSGSRLSLSKAFCTFFDPLRNFGGPSNKMPTLKVSSFTDLSEIEPSCSTIRGSPTGRKKKRKSSSFGAFAINI